jgi:hypothetical protein
VPLTVSNAVLVKWRNAGPGFVPPQQVTEGSAQLIVPNYDAGPSVGDVEAVKAMYSWGG